MPPVSPGACRMTVRDDDLTIRPGRIRHGGHGAKRAKSFVGEVMRAAQKAGHVGKRFGASRGGGAGSKFGRGRQASLALSLRSSSRRVAVKARVVRHGGARFRAAPMARHLLYLKRDGVTRDGAEAGMFGASSEVADERAFAERCADDRHHFRFIVSPEDGGDLDDLRAFTRELMADAETDLGTRLDWVAVDHWNTENPHVHLLIRGRADDGADLVISRDYISRGLRERAAQRVTLELGPRSELQIRSALEADVEAERWTGLDRALRTMADDNVGVADLRPGVPGEDPEFRRLMLGRAAKLERLGLAETAGPACWALKPGAEEILRDLAARGDVIATMHQALTKTGRDPDVSGFAIHGDEVSDALVGRLVARGLHDELKGSAYAIVEGVDGRTHHLRFSDLEMTGDGQPGAIVEARSYPDAKGRQRLSLATRSDLTVEAQVAATGATWLDRQLVAREPAVSRGGFGADVREAMERRADHLEGQGLAQRQGQRVIFARGMIQTLRDRELGATSAKLASETGLQHRPSAEGEHVSGVYRRRVTLASGRFAMIDDGLGFQLVPWRPALEQQLGRQVGGVMLPGGGVDWRLGRQRGLGL
jgi:type IV secretory pathway VirD2 relaxase